MLADLAVRTINCPNLLATVPVPPVTTPTPESAMSMNSSPFLILFTVESPEAPTATAPRTAPTGAPTPVTARIAAAPPATDETVSRISGSQSSGFHQASPKR
jgi:hypothetical protein